MATTEHDVLMSNIDESGNVQLIYPVTKGANVVGAVEDSGMLDGKAASEYVQTANVVNSFTTTDAGYVADARAVAAVNDGLSRVKNAAYINAATLDAVKTQLVAINSQLADSESKALFFALAGAEGGFAAYMVYSGWLMRENATAFKFLAASRSGEIVNIGYSAGAWAVSNLSARIAALEAAVTAIQGG